MSACKRSGYCCKMGTCALGVYHGAPAKGCTFLRGDKPGEYACGLIALRPDLAPLLYIGEGCCSPLNGERLRLLRGD